MNRFFVFMAIPATMASRRQCAFLLSVLPFATPYAFAEAVWTTQNENGADVEVVRMEVTPADEPTPAFKHRLTSLPHELVPGNSVAHYMRAFPEGGIERTWKSLRDKYGEVLEDWYGTDIAISALPMEQVRAAASSFDSLVDSYVSKGAACRETDWGVSYVDIRGPEVISFLLPEIQSMRGIARAMALHTRAAIADGQYNKAIDELRMSYRLGRDVGQQPILVSNLVGVAICGITNSNTTDLIASPGSPNLYWALTELPSPQVDMRRSMRLELAIGPRMFEMLDNPENKKLASAEWNALWMRSAKYYNENQFWDSGVRESASVSEMFTPVGYGLLGYSHAKKRLVDWGYAPKEVDAMAVGQVLSIYSARAYQISANELEKSIYVGFREGQILGQASEERLSSFGPQALGPLGNDPNREIVPIASLLLPAIRAVQSAQYREIRNLDALRVIEALRMHAAQNDGQWPGSLADITCVPVPNNVATDEPFEYELIGATAVLTLPVSDGFHMEKRYELTIAK